MTQAVLCRESRPVIDLRGGTFTGPVCDSGRTGRLERDMDRMEEILEKVEERLNSLGSHFDAARTDLGYIRVAVMTPNAVLKGREEEITVLD